MNITREDTVPFTISGGARKATPNTKVMDDSGQVPTRVADQSECVAALTNAIEMLQATACVGCIGEDNSAGKQEYPSEKSSSNQGTSRADTFRSTLTENGKWSTGLSWRGTLGDPSHPRRQFTTKTDIEPTTKLPTSNCGHQSTLPDNAPRTYSNSRARSSSCTDDDKHIGNQLMRILTEGANE